MGSCITGWRVNTSLKQPAEGPRVGLFGLLGTGNIGNDASMEAVLRYVQTRHPSAVIDVMCSGPERVTEQYGIDAAHMFWFDRHKARLSGPLASGQRILSRFLMCSASRPGSVGTTQ